jgi:hypothetical protein
MFESGTVDQFPAQEYPAVHARFERQPQRGEPDDGYFERSFTKNRLKKFPIIPKRRIAVEKARGS